MKRVISILSLLLLFSPLFSVEITQFNLTTTIGLKQKHGFTDDIDGLTSYNAIIGTDSLGNTSKTLDLTTATPQDAGYYVFASNNSGSFTVKFTLNPLSYDGESSSSLPKVPYTLNATIKYGDDNPDVNIGFTESAPEVNITPTTKSFLEKSAPNSSPIWAIWELTVTFDSQAITSTGLLAGSYKGTITAEITTD